MEEIKKYIKTDEDNYVFKKLIDTVNNYYFIDDYNDVKDFIIEDLSNIKMYSKKYDNSVKLVDIDNIRDNDYVFLMNFNEGSFPIKHKDEDFLSDKEKKSLNISTSSELNEYETINIINNIKKANHLTVTYSKYNLKGEIFVSSIYNEDLFEECNYEEDYSSSNLFNQVELIKLLDNNRKFGSVDNNLGLLLNSYNKQPYLDYDNKFNGIDKKSLNKYLNNSLTLSYTSINSYYQCLIE